MFIHIICVYILNNIILQFSYINLNELKTYLCIDLNIKFKYVILDHKL